jgi:hypothetical protein
MNRTQLRLAVLIRTLLALSLLSPGARTAGAQQPVALTLTGVVVDAGSGAPVSGALLTAGEQGPRALSDREGRFRLADLPAGTHTLTVQRFGYRTLVASVRAGADAVPLELRMEPAPIALDTLTVAGGARVAVRGRVRSAGSDEPVPWTTLSLTPDAVRETGRATSDDQGIFSIDGVPTGPYLLRVERLGYVSQYLPVEATAPPELIEVRLEPDSAALAGVLFMERRMSSRAAATGFSTRAFGESLLQRSQARGMRQFLDSEGSANLVPCADARIRNDCFASRGRLLNTHVFIDEMLVFGLDQLDTYLPRDFFRVEMLACSGAFVIRAYTYAYMERVARRAQALLPPCNIPPLPA